MTDERVERFFDALRWDCRHFRTDRPCDPHKKRGVVCATCDEYDPCDLRITVVKLAAIGDVLRTTALLPGLRRKYPGARVEWLTLWESVPLFGGNTLVHAVHGTSGSTVPASLAMVPQDIVICPDADIQTVALAQSLRLRKGGRRVGFSLTEDGRVQPLSPAAQTWFVMGLSDDEKRRNRTTYQNLVGAILELPLPVEDRPALELDAAERAAARAWFKWMTAKRALAPRHVIGLNTGAGRRWPRKQWTLENQVGFIRRMHERGCLTVLLGGPDEAQRHLSLLQACPRDSCLDAGTDNDLRDFCARLDLCNVIVTGDTLALHVATALGKKVVALFGPTSPHEIELYGTGSKLFAAELDCLGCYSVCQRSPHCQDLIRVDDVASALESLVEVSPAAGT